MTWFSAVQGLISAWFWLFKGRSALDFAFQGLIVALEACFQGLQRLFRLLISLFQPVFKPSETFFPFFQGLQRLFQPFFSLFQTFFDLFIIFLLALFKAFNPQRPTFFVSNARIFGRSSAGHETILDSLPSKFTYIYSLCWPDLTRFPAQKGSRNTKTNPFSFFPLLPTWVGEEFRFFFGRSNHPCCESMWGSLQTY